MSEARRDAARRSARRAAVPSAGWIDITVPLRTNMVHWPGDPDVRIKRLQYMERGDPCNLSFLSMGAHTGTHVDAPLHFVPGGAALDAMPLSATIGPARVIEIVDPEAVHAVELRNRRLQAGERVLFKTRNSSHCWADAEFTEDYVYVARDAAEYLAERGVCAVGSDYLSVGGFRRDSHETHIVLLGAGIWIIEGLDLSTVRPGRYELICLPLKIQGGDGGPARAIIRKLERQCAASE
jgi:arylformamidase